jgi:hypothetical protein
MKFLLPCLLMVLLQTGSIIGAEAQFTPPSEWRSADPAILPKHVKIMVVGQGSHEMPPSINLGYEEFSGSLKDYLKIVKEFNKSQGDPWTDLGTIETKSGPASLSQVDMASEWGTIRQMHVILLKDSVIYILTAAALKEEFPKFYPAFFESLKSLQIS